jgi:hypothetical protein
LSAFDLIIRNGMDINGLEGRLDFWRTSAGRGAFFARVKESDIAVLNNGGVTWSE